MKKFRIPRKLKKYYNKHVKKRGILYDTWKKHAYIISRNKKGNIQIWYKPSYTIPNEINLKELRLAYKLEEKLEKLMSIGKF